MNCCHLDLILENIIVNNGNFILNRKTNTVRIDKKLSFKICDFGLAEVFQNKNGKQYVEYDPDEENLSTFHINTKFGTINPFQAPQIFAEEVYDARYVLI